MTWPSSRHPQVSNELSLVVEQLRVGGGRSPSSASAVARVDLDTLGMTDEEEFVAGGNRDRGRDLRFGGLGLGYLLRVGNLRHGQGRCGSDESHD
jgi:hypothetical protein